MSTSRVRHRGEVPRDIDHGPSTGASHAQGPAAAVARLGAFTTASLVPSGGAGPIERRMASDAQREAWRAEPARAKAVVPIRATIEYVGTHSKGSAEERAAASKARQAAYLASQAVIPVIPVTPVTPEELVMEPIAAPEPMTATLAIHIDAAKAAQDAWEAFDAADTARIHAEEAWLAARAALEASWLALWEQRSWMSPAELGGDDPDPTPATSTESSTDIPETIPVAAPPARAAAQPDPTSKPSAAFAAFSAERAAAAPEAGGGPGIPPFLRRMLDALVAADGDYTKAAGAIGIKRTSLVGTMGRLRKLPGLTDAELAVVARKR